MNVIMKKCIILFFALVFCMSCKDNTGQNNVIKLNPGENAIDVSIHSENRIIICPDTSRLGFINKALFYGNDYLFQSGGDLLLFNEEGKFVRKIGRRGRAKDEYVSCSDFWIENDWLYVYDLNSKKIISYSLCSNDTNSSYIEDKALNGFPFDMLLPFRQGYVGRCVWKGNEVESPALAYYDPEYNFKTVLGNVTVRSGLKLGYPLVHAEKESLLYWNPLGRDIFRINSDLSVTKECEIFFDEKSNFPNLETIDEYDLLDKVRDPEWMSSHCGLITYLWEYKNHLIFTYYVGETLYLTIYNENTDDVVSVNFNDSPNAAILTCMFQKGKVHILLEEETQITDNIFDLSQILSL